MYWTFSKRCVFVTFAFVVILGDSNSVLGDRQCGEGKDETITSVHGDTVVLPCILQSILLKNQLITWRKGSGDTQIRCETPKNCSYFPAVMPDDRQRFGILTNYENNFTIQITNAKVIDSSTYYCELHEGSKHICNVSIVTLNVTEQSIQSATPTLSRLTQEISTAFSSGNTSIVSIINSTALPKVSTTLLPNKQTQLHTSELVILAVTITTLLILLLFAALCCILIGNTLEISTRPRNHVRRRVDIRDSNVHEMKLMRDGEEEHEHDEGVESLQHVLNRERINRHSGMLRPHSDRFRAQVTDKDYLIPQPVSSDESYELVECPDPMYFVVNCSDSDNDGALTTDTSLQPAPSTSTSASVGKSNIISEEINVLKNTQVSKFSFCDEELPTSPQLLQDDERTVDFPKNTDDDEPSIRPYHLDGYLRKHLSCSPSLGDRKIIPSSAAVPAHNPCQIKMSTTSKEGPIVSTNNNEHKDINDKGHDDNYEIPVLQHPFGAGESTRGNTEGSLSPPTPSFLQPLSVPSGQPSPQLLPRMPSPTQHAPPLPPSPPPLPKLMPEITLQRRQRSSRLLPLPPLPKENKIPSPPPSPPSSTVLPLLPPELHGGYNSLINMTYESAYDRLKH